MLIHHTGRQAVGFGILVFTGMLIFVESGCSSDAPGPKTESPQAHTAPVSPLENKMIRRPGKTPEDSKVYVVQGGQKHWVVNAAWFSAHGFRFTAVVTEVTPSVFDSIPTGEPIQ